MTMGTTKEAEESLKTWMADLPINIRSLPIINLSIPGSHNTFSYSISKDADVSPDAPKIVQRLSRMAKHIVNPIIFKWSRTQIVEIKNQLDSGIRYLDIRIVSRCNEIYVAHGLYGGLLYPYLGEIDNFLSKNSGEVVILDFQHFYNFQLQDHQALLATLGRIYSEKLSHRVRDLKSISLQAMFKAGEQVFIIYRSGVGRDFPYVWPSCLWPTPWPNKLKVRDLIEYLSSELSSRSDDIGLVTQCLLTPDPTYVVCHPFSNLKKMAARTNSELIPWVQRQHAGPKGINVVICDFVDSFEFAKTIVQLNYK